MFKYYNIIVYNLKILIHEDIWKWSFFIIPFQHLLNCLKVFTHLSHTTTTTLLLLFIRTYYDTHIVIHSTLSFLHLTHSKWKIFRMSVHNFIAFHRKTHHLVCIIVYGIEISYIKLSPFSILYAPILLYGKYFCESLYVYIYIGIHYYSFLKGPRFILKLRTLIHIYMNMCCMMLQDYYPFLYKIVDII